MNRRKISRALAAASMLVLAAVPGAASAQQIDRIIVFGDSYADTGNFFRIAGINPATTGEMEKGKSISVVSSARPGKRKRAIDQAAARPKITLAVTAIGATVSVSKMACQVSAPAVRFFQYIPRPA